MVSGSIRDYHDIDAQAGKRLCTVSPADAADTAPPLFLTDGVFLSADGMETILRQVLSAHEVDAHLYDHFALYRRKRKPESHRVRVIRIKCYDAMHF